MKHTGKLLWMTALLVCTQALFFWTAAQTADKATHAGLGDAAPEVCFECHKELAAPPKGGVVHAAFAMGDCSVCHVLDENNRFQLMETGGDLCYMCHEPNNTKAKVHSPVASGDCVLCHNPHQSPNPKMLMDYPVNKLCFNCHEEEMAKHTYLHLPVAEGECLSCHDPHESPHDKQLLEAGDALCLMCHADKQEDLEEKKHVHGAIEMVGCTGCHSPHGSATKYQLLQKPPTLCFSCHAEKEEKVKHTHGAVTDQKSCMNCHNPHASDYPAMTESEQVELCLSCHNRKRKSAKGFVMNMKTHLDKNPEHHGPILMGECAACHNPHGSNEWRMLIGAFPSTFYTPFEAERYSLCFECHDSELVTEAQTTSATGFRNGEKNLHSVHVNDGEKGRRCVVCHDVHGAKGPKLIRESTRFGSWEFGHNFKVEADGGRCATGCHLPRSYNRSQAVENR